MSMANDLNTLDIFRFKCTPLCSQQSANKEAIKKKYGVNLSALNFYKQRSFLAKSRGVSI
jgi:hypothetical protein